MEVDLAVTVGRDGEWDELTKSHGEVVDCNDIFPGSIRGVV